MGWIRPMSEAERGVISRKDVLVLTKRPQRQLVKGKAVIDSFVVDGGNLMKKVMLILLAVMFVASSAWAGTIPEFDAVGCDCKKVFAKNNPVQYGQVIDNNIGPNGPLNKFSAIFPSSPQEYFMQTAGQLYPDPCFGDLGLLSALTDSWSASVYEWYIIFQMKPESDLNISIYDCVLKAGEFSPWVAAEQTGRYRAVWGQPFIVLSANPRIAVKAYPGEYATPGFTDPFIMDSRILPGLEIVALDDVLYTSKAIWSEALVLVMPETGKTNTSGQPMYTLKRGDRIYVKVTIPHNNTCDIRYGPDSVIVKYIGTFGNWYYGDPCP